jgi:hypothetical protein
VVSFTPRPLYPEGKSPWYPFDRKLGGPQSRSRRGGEEKNSQPPFIVLKVIEYYYGDQVEDEIGGTYGTHGTDQKRVKNFGRKT